MTNTTKTDSDPSSPPPITDENTASPEITKEDNSSNEDDVAADAEEPIFLHKLCILPPLQKDGDSEDIAKDAVLLPSIAPAEPVSAIRNALGEIRGYAHITNYRLVVEDIDDDLHQSIVDQSKKRVQDEGKLGIKPNNNNNKNGKNSGGKKKNKKGGANFSTHKNSVAVQNVVSPYTSSKASIQVSSSSLSLNDDPMFDNGEEEEIVLNDFGDLSSYVDSDELDSNMGLRMILERYDVGLVKEHVIKTRFLLDGNAPCVIRVVGDDEEQNEEQKEDKNDGSESTDVKENGSDTKKETEGEDTAVS